MSASNRAPFDLQRKHTLSQSNRKTLCVCVCVCVPLDSMNGKSADMLSFCDSMYVSALFPIVDHTHANHVTITQVSHDDYSGVT